MTQRNETERDFTLKTAIRTILWAQGYSTRLDVLLAYDFDPRKVVQVKLDLLILTYWEYDWIQDLGYTRLLPIVKLQKVKFLNASFGYRE